MKQNKQKYKNLRNYFLKFQDIYVHWRTHAQQNKNNAEILKKNK